MCNTYYSLLRSMIWGVSHELVFRFIDIGMNCWPSLFKLSFRAFSIGVTYKKEPFYHTYTTCLHSVPTRMSHVIIRLHIIWFKTGTHSDLFHKYLVWCAEYGAVACYNKHMILSIQIYIGVTDSSMITKTVRWHLNPDKSRICKGCSLITCRDWVKTWQSL